VLLCLLSLFLARFVRKGEKMDKETALLYNNSANAYYLGATILMKPPKGTVPALSMAQPAVTCAALALKLYFKCLLALEDNDSDDPMPLAGMFRRLKEGTRSALLSRFDEFSNTAMTSDELLQLLESLDSAFDRWRFIHELNARNVNIEDLEEMILAAKATIIAVNPRWR
jgi:hypothetical protein